MIKQIVCFHGKSNVGKSTLSRHLAHRIGARMTTPMNKTKRFFEELWNIPYGSLDSQDGKNILVSSYTTGEILRDLFHFWDEHDSDYSAKCLHSELNEQPSRRLVIESLRFPGEINVINRIKQRHQAQLIVFNVYSDDAIEYSTDKQLWDCLMSYELEDDDCFYPIYNDKQSLQDVVDYVHKIWRLKSKVEV